MCWFNGISTLCKLEGPVAVACLKFANKNQDVRSAMDYPSVNKCKYKIKIKKARLSEHDVLCMVVA